MAWHLGYPLSQTLFTNVYVEALLMPFPQTITEAHFIRNGEGAVDYDMMNKNPVASILRAYCLGLLKSCHFVNERIKSEHYYEVWSSTICPVFQHERRADVRAGRGFRDEHVSQIVA